MVSSAASYAQVAGTSTSRKKNKQAKQQEAVQNHLQEKRPEAPNSLEHGQLRQRRRPLVPIKGARKVWNTYKFVTASAVSHAVQKITSISAADLSIKRKYKSNGKVLSWWFVVRGEETILEQLDRLWEQVYLQTKWDLKPLLSFSDSETSESLPSENDTSKATPPNPTTANALPSTNVTPHSCQQRMSDGNSPRAPDNAHCDKSGINSPHPNNTSESDTFLDKHQHHAALVT